MMPTDADSFVMSNTDNNERQIVRAELDRLTLIIGEHRAPPKFVCCELAVWGVALVGSRSHPAFALTFFRPPRPPYSVRGTSPIEPPPCPKGCVLACGAV
eukprot:2466721-Amphidinium_carterae.1